MSKRIASTIEGRRLEEDAARKSNWKRWGPYLSERQWGTVREDNSADGNCWDYLPHDHARSRAYRWGEDGLLGFCDRQCRLCFCVALWNGKDPILKERLFGLTNPQGNHGEDVKEVYHYLDSTPTHSYCKATYRYPQAEFPYDKLVKENKERSNKLPEYEILDTGVFDEGRYFQVTAEYAKASESDIAIRITIENRGPEAADIHLLPTLWFRNTWSWGIRDEGEAHEHRPLLRAAGPNIVQAEHSTLGRYALAFGPGPDGADPQLLFTENDTNTRRLFNVDPPSPWVKDAFHDRVIQEKLDAVNPRGEGTKAAGWYRMTIPAGQTVRLRLRLSEVDQAVTFKPNLSADLDEVFRLRIAEADEFYRLIISPDLSETERQVARQAYAGLLWSKQFYHYVVEQWLKGDPAQPPPPAQRLHGRNSDWPHMYNRDIISMPDKWEYPWYAAWDLAFHTIGLARVDPDFAKQQLILMLREWYMHPNGQIPAYEFNFSDVNPPVHAWACWRVYKIEAPRGRRDRQFLASAFQKLLINFTWWVNRKDPDGKHLFSGGFLGLDNIGVFDRSHALPRGGRLEQADGTAWMAFYSSTMLSIALELAREESAYEDMASKFFEHYISIADAINHFDGSGLWDEQDGFYYDRLHVDGASTPLRVRSMVGLVPLLAVQVLPRHDISCLRGFSKRLDWFLRHRADLARRISLMQSDQGQDNYLLALASRQRLLRILRYLLDESEFLSPCGIRSLSKAHLHEPYSLWIDGQEHRVQYEPGESSSQMFGGNSNWRGPVWFPLNVLIIEALERYDHYFGPEFKVECPTGSGRFMTLAEVARELHRRLGNLMMPGPHGYRPSDGPHRPGLDARWYENPLFHEYFHGDSGLGLGASHQTGWTALVAQSYEELARFHTRNGGAASHGPISVHF